jgi:hypothetical protein
MTIKLKPQDPNQDGVLGLDIQVLALSSSMLG